MQSIYHLCTALVYQVAVTLTFHYLFFPFFLSDHCQGSSDGSAVAGNFAAAVSDTLIVHL